MPSSPNIGYLTQIVGMPWIIARESFSQNMIRPDATDQPIQYPWFKSGRIYMGNTPGSSPYLLPWGVISKTLDRTYNTDVLVKVRNLQLWIRTLSGPWVNVRTRAVPKMAQYNARNAAGDYVRDATLFSNSTTSVISNLEPDVYLHFFGPDTIDEYLIPNVNDVGGIITSYEAKIISASGANIASEVGSVIGVCSTDYRVTPANNPTGDSFVGSFKPLQPYWQKFYGGSVNLSTLIAYPPPAGLTQIAETYYNPGIDPDYIP